MKPLTSREISDLLSANPGATVHLVGAGGCGVSGLGHLLLDLGHGVTGSDVIENEEVRQLRARGARIHLGHAARQVADANPILLVHSSAVPRDNAELVQAAQMHVPVARRAVLLAALLHRQRGICVAGMHGKTTTSSLLSYALQKVAANPSHAIGAQVPQLGRHARLAWPGGGAPAPWFVIEADESDGSLREFHPEHAILLNVDAEHLDHYEDIDAVCAEFRRFAAQVSGTLVYCADDLLLRDLFSHGPNSVSYGIDTQSDYQIIPSGPPGPSRRFGILSRGSMLGEFSIRLHGEQNVSNAAAVIAMLHQIGYTAEAIAPAIADFTGAARRQEELFWNERFRVFDDYGHHPAEIEATLRSLKALGRGRLLVAFQPHRFTRTKALRSQFATCFHDADLLWLTEIYPASEPPIPGVNGQMLADAVRATGQPAEFIPDLDGLRRSVRAAMRPDDIVLFLGAGDITQAAHAFADALRRDSVPG
jgi:UDP-N-acetylmuramate--L-alanine ligase